MKTAISFEQSFVKPDGTTAGITEMLLQSHRRHGHQEPILDLRPTL